MFFVFYFKYPNSGSVDKEVGTFSKGQVQLSATINKEVYSPGKSISVYLEQNNAVYLQIL